MYSFERFGNFLVAYSHCGNFLIADSHCGCGFLIAVLVALYGECKNASNEETATTMMRIRIDGGAAIIQIIWNFPGVKVGPAR
jgi:hypothetical protein